MCIETSYLALCSHYNSYPTYDFCHAATDNAILRSRSVRFYLWRWSGRDLDKIDWTWQRTQPCNRIRVSRKTNDPYWRNRVCDGCREEMRREDRIVKEQYGEAERAESSGRLGGRRRGRRVDQ